MRKLGIRSTGPHDFDIVERMQIEDHRALFENVGRMAIGATFLLYFDLGGGNESRQKN